MKGSVTAAWLAIRTNAGVALTDAPGGPCARQHGSRCWHPRLVEGSPRISDSSPHTCWNWVARSHACTPHTAATQAWEPVAPSSQEAPGKFPKVPGRRRPAEGWQLPGEGVLVETGLWGLLGACHPNNTAGEGQGRDRNAGRPPSWLLPLSHMACCDGGTISSP